MTFPLTNFSSILTLPTHVLIAHLIAQRNAINAFLASRVKPKKERAPRKPRTPKLDEHGNPIIKPPRAPRKPRAVVNADPNAPVVVKERKKRITKAEKEFMQKMQTLKERMRSLSDNDAEKIMIREKMIQNGIVTEKEWEKEWKIK